MEWINNPSDCAVFHSDIQFHRDTFLNRKKWNAIYNSCANIASKKKNKQNIYIYLFPSNWKLLLVFYWIRKQILFCEFLGLKAFAKKYMNRISTIFKIPYFNIHDQSYLMKYHVILLRSMENNKSYDTFLHILLKESWISGIPR